jgi:hypothetical protein
VLLLGKMTRRGQALHRFKSACPLRGFMRWLFLISVGLYPSIEYEKVASFSSRISIKGDENMEIISSVCSKKYASIVAVFNYSEMDNYKYFEKIRSIFFYKNLTQEYPKSDSCLRVAI